MKRKFPLSSHAVSLIQKKTFHAVCAILWAVLTLVYLDRQTRDPWKDRSAVAKYLKLSALTIELKEITLPNVVFLKSAFQ